MRSNLVIASLLMSAALAVTAQTPGDVRNAPVTGTAVIRGRVVAAETGEPLSGVRIDASTTVLVRAGAGRRTTTDDRGRFELAGLPGGLYTISAAKGGYHPLTFDQRRPSDAIQGIDLADGDEFDASFVLFRVGVIAGRVLDVYGDPLMGVNVGAERYRYVNGHRTLDRPFGSDDHTRWVSRTDDRGEFRLFGLPPGAYVVSAATFPEQLSAPGGEDGYARTYHPGTTLAARAEPIVLGPGDAREGVVIRMIASRMAMLSGMALDAGGRPYADARLELRDATRTTTGLSGTDAIAVSASIDVRSDGSFSISRVAPGAYYLDLRPVPPAHNEAGRLPLVVAGNDVTGLVIRGQQGFPARGRIVGPDGRPAAEPVSVEFMAFPPDPDSRWASRRSAADATFEVPTLRGRQAIRAVMAAPSADWAVRRITHQGQDVTDGTLDFAQGPIDDIVIELTRTIASLGGTVRDTRGGIPRDAVVVVFADDPARWTPPSRFIRTARVEPDGTFLVRALPPGHQYVVIAVESLEPAQETSVATLEALRHTAASTRLWLGEGDAGRVDVRLWDGS